MDASEPHPHRHAGSRPLGHRRRLRPRRGSRTCGPTARRACSPAGSSTTRSCTKPARTAPPTSPSSCRPTTGWAHEGTKPPGQSAIWPGSKATSRTGCFSPKACALVHWAERRSIRSKGAILGSWTAASGVAADDITDWEDTKIGDDDHGGRCLDRHRDLHASRPPARFLFGVEPPAGGRDVGGSVRVREDSRRRALVHPPAADRGSSARRADDIRHDPSAAVGRRVRVEPGRDGISSAVHADGGTLRGT